MSEPDAVPLPREGEVFFDVRGAARSMRLSWYADSRVAVFSIWQGDRCTGTFRLPFGDLARMVQTLQHGPQPAATAMGSPSRPGGAGQPPYDPGSYPAPAASDPARDAYRYADLPGHPSYAHATGYADIPHSDLPGYRDSAGYDRTGTDYRNPPGLGAGPDYGHLPGHGAGPDYGNPPHHGAGPDYGNPPHHGAGPDYGNLPRHGADPDYGNLPRHGADPDYGNLPRHGADPDYLGVPGHGTTGGIASSAGFASTAGFASPAGFASTAGYPSTAGHAGTAGYTTHQDRDLAGYRAVPTSETRRYRDLPGSADLPPYPGRPDIPDLPSYPRQPEYAPDYAGPSGYPSELAAPSDRDYDHIEPADFGRAGRTFSGVAGQSQWLAAPAVTTNWGMTSDEPDGLADFPSVPAKTGPAPSDRGRSSGY